MCLIGVSMKQNNEFPFIMAANRDEFYERPTQKLHQWEDEPEILAGRDEVAGGTWMGMSQSGRIAALTNVREVPGHENPKKSRGNIVRDYLGDPLLPAEDFLGKLNEEATLYDGFNLLAGTPDKLHYVSNRSSSTETLTKGIYGLSNGTLHSDWPKVRYLKRGMAELGNSLSRAELTERLFSLLQEADPFPDKHLPDTGVGMELERMLSPLFIQAESYGTRCSTILLMDDSGRLVMTERTFDGGNVRTRSEEITLSSNRGCP
ncbi:NRDE family protein [Alteribacter natronophilus]|uniref:NRDE family protein n=1 Tax=Alteribacter natronophilus TaxID=2583810 RepID=UPI00110EA44C|nr:NRDE family protein [Alteribacter natronophilus]TMW73532.1 NRDE family protein [Alteribacter natronophilus]